MTSFPVPYLHALPPFGLLATLLLAAALLSFTLAAVLLARRNSRPPLRVRRGSHSNRPADEWHKSLAKIRRDYHRGRITETQAYSRLSGLARDFASQRLGVDLSTATLLDLNQHRPVSSKQQFTRLRETIAALYPPEFAPKSDVRSRQANVDEAANWVADLLERWDR